MSLAAMAALGSGSSSVPRSRRTSSLQLISESVLAASSMLLRDGLCSVLRARRRWASVSSGVSWGLAGVCAAAPDAEISALNVSVALSHSHTGATCRGVTNRGVCSSPRKVACTAASQGTSLPRRLCRAGRWARWAVTKRWWRSRRPAKRCSARAVPARLSAIQSPVGSNTAARAASHRYRSRLRSVRSNTPMCGGSASVWASSSGRALRRPLPATFCSQRRGPPWLLAATGATRTAASPPPARKSSVMLRCMSCSATWASVRCGSARWVMARCHHWPIHSSIRGLHRAVGAGSLERRPVQSAIAARGYALVPFGLCRKRSGIGRIARTKTSCV